VAAPYLMSTSTDLQTRSSYHPEFAEDAGDLGPWLQQTAPPSRSAVGRFLAALLRYKWLMVGFTTTAVAAGFLTWRLIRPDYAVQGSLWINQARVGAAGPITEGRLLQSFDWIELLRSFTVLDPVVVEQRLYLDHLPEDATLFESFRIREGESFRPGRYRLEVAEAGGSYTLRTREGLVVESGATGDPIGARLGFVWAPPASELTPGRTLGFIVLSPRDAAVALGETIATRMEGVGSFIQLGFRDSDPQRAAGVLSSVMQRTVDVAGELKRSQADETNRILAEQLRVVEDDLRQAERELEVFRVETITLPTDEGAPVTPGLGETRGPVMNEFFRLRLELEALKQDREQLEEVLATQPGSELRVAALELIPAVRQSSELVRDLQQLAEARGQLGLLSERYTDEFEPVREARAKVTNLTDAVIPQAAQKVLSELKAREAALNRVVQSRSDELEQIPPRMIEEARLTRRVAIATQLFTELRQRYEVSSLASRSTTPDVQILDKPVVPTVPEGDQRIKLAGMVFAGILGVAVGLVFLLDRMDPRLRDPFDVMGEIGLPILGAVPHLKSRVAGSESQVREAFRELRVNLDYAHGTARPLVVCVTSPAEQEGKSFVCANIAIAFAGLGRRTLLIDGDTRRGNAHELLRLTRKPGLTDYLVSGHDPLGHLQRSEHENLWLMPSGGRRSASPELLNSRAMQELLAAARKGFDVIIVDSPPLGAGADAFVLAAHAGSLVLVVRSGSTNKALTTVKLEPLLRLPVRILGAVLNDFVPSKLYGGFGYYGEYIAGYEAHDEVPDQVAARSVEPAPSAVTS
jgi:succinoglycan biosynthesis transport protein ExoP